MAESNDKNAAEEEKAGKDETAEDISTEESGEGGGDGAEEARPDSAEGAGNEAPAGDETVTEDVWAEAMKEAEGGASEDETVTEDAWEEALKEAAPAGQEQAAAPPIETQPADFAQLKGSVTGSLASMDMILDIPVTVSVELGRSVMLIKDILQLGQGSVVELEKMAGEPMEILVNGRLVARGEVVMVNEKFGVRLTDVISPAERVKRLG